MSLINVSILYPGEDTPIYSKFVKSTDVSALTFGQLVVFMSSDVASSVVLPKKLGQCAGGNLWTALMV